MKNEEVESAAPQSASAQSAGSLQGERETTCGTCGAEWWDSSAEQEARTRCWGRECMKCGRVARFKESMFEYIERELLLRGASLTEIRDSCARSFGAGVGAAWNGLPDGMEKADFYREIDRIFNELRQREGSYWRGTSLFLKRHGQPPLEVGTKLYRQVFFHMSGSTRVADYVPLEKTDKGSFLVHGDWGHCFNSAGSEIWTAISKSYKGRGFKCFSQEQAPENWTHFEVTGFARNGRSAFVKPIAGDQKELIAAHGTPDAFKPGKAPASAPTAPPVTAQPSAPPKPKPYICYSCAKKGFASAGPGTCAVCKNYYVG